MSATAVIPPAAASSEPVTVTVARRVARGREGDFQDWADAALRAADRRPGFLGGGVLRPPHAGGDWHIVYRFASDEHLRAWEASRERVERVRAAEEFAEELGVHRTSGLETWFALPGRTAPTPPRWKMAVVTLLAIVPLVLLMNVAVQPHVAEWPLVPRTVLFSGTLTTLMTWVVMPRMTRVFRRFLYGGS